MTPAPAERKPWLTGTVLAFACVHTRGVSSTHLYPSLALPLTTMGSRLVTISLCYGFTPSPQLSRNSSLSSASPPRVSPLPQHPQTSPQGTVLSTLQHLGGSEDPSSPESSGFLEDEQVVF